MKNKHQKQHKSTPSVESEKIKYQSKPAKKDPQQVREEKVWRADAPDIPDTPEKVRETKDKSHRKPKNYLTKEDLPDATNESEGRMGSGLRQDSN